MITRRVEQHAVVGCHVVTPTADRHVDWLLVSKISGTPEPRGGTVSDHTFPTPRQGGRRSAMENGTRVIEERVRVTDRVNEDAAVHQCSGSGRGDAKGSQLVAADGTVLVLGESVEVGEIHAPLWVGD